MNDQEQSLATLQDIKRVMERSGRFISLSGLSGISAGICALIGAWLAWDYVYGHKDYLITGLLPLLWPWPKITGLLFIPGYFGLRWVPWLPL